MPSVKDQLHFMYLYTTLEANKLALGKSENPTSNTVMMKSPGFAMRWHTLYRVTISYTHSHNSAWPAHPLNVLACNSPMNIVWYPAQCSNINSLFVILNAQHHFNASPVRPTAVLPPVSIAIPLHHLLPQQIPSNAHGAHNELRAEGVLWNLPSGSLGVNQVTTTRCCQRWTYPDSKALFFFVFPFL